MRELTYTASARPFFANEAEKLGLVSKIVEGSRDEEKVKFTKFRQKGENSMVPLIVA